MSKQNTQHRLPQKNLYSLVLIEEVISKEKLLTENTFVGLNQRMTVEGVTDHTSTVKSVTIKNVLTLSNKSLQYRHHINHE